MERRQGAVRTVANDASSNGLQLAWAEFGDLTGDPVLHFHGHPGSRLEGRLAAKVAERLGVRLIALDRPGMGHSEFDSRRQLTDWPDTIAEFVDHLGLDRFAVQGASGGGPYALACAWRNVQKVIRISLRLVAVRTEKEWFHGSFVAASLVYQFSWAVRLYEKVG